MLWLFFFYIVEPKRYCSSLLNGLNRDKHDNNLQHVPMFLSLNTGSVRETNYIYHDECDETEPKQLISIPGSITEESRIPDDFALQGLFHFKWVSFFCSICTFSCIPKFQNI